MELLSKKELLALTGISYGQLYRWKREQLIPEEWFIKQSSYTGQETFFPKEKILDRVSAILEMKDAHSLEALAKMLTPEISNAISLQTLQQIVAFDADQWEIIQTHFGQEDYRLIEVAFLALVYEASRNGLSLQAFEKLIQYGRDIVLEQKHLDIHCTIFMTDHGCHIAFSKEAVTFDSSIEIVVSKLLSETASDIKMKHNDLLIKNS